MDKTIIEHIEEIYFERIFCYKIKLKKWLKMNYTPAEKILINYIQKEINSGKTRIVIPVEFRKLIMEIREEVLEEIERLCELCGVELEFE